LLGLAFAGLTGNYVLYIKGLQHSSPTVVETVGQLGPMFLLFGGLVIFKEYFSRLQWVGFAVLSLGLVLFFSLIGTFLVVSATCALARRAE
jgi:drug/metabolite transporter (DMT)-like permease